MHAVQISFVSAAGGKFLTRLIVDRTFELDLRIVFAIGDEQIEGLYMGIFLHWRSS